MEFQLLPAFVDYIDTDNFELFITELLKEAVIANLSGFKYFASSSDEDLRTFLAIGNRALFKSLKNHTLEHYIEQAQERWLERQLPLINEHELPTNDGALYNYIRKKVFLKFIRTYTSDSELQFNLIAEVDLLLLKLNAAFNNSFASILNSKIQQELYFNEKISETFQGIIYVFDLVEGKDVYNNSKLGEILGYTNHELHDMGADILSIVIHPDDLPAAFSRIQELKQLQPGQISVWECRAKDKRGSYKWIQTHQSIFKTDEQGDVVQIIGIGTDITEYKTAQAELASSQRDLEIAQEIAGLGSYEWEIGTRNVNGSYEFKKMFEWDAEGKNDRRSKINPQDIAKVEQAMELSAQTHQDLDCEYRINTINGERIVWSRGKIIDRDGKKIMKGTILDITEKSRLTEQLKKSDYLYKQAQTLSHIGNWEMDIATNSLIWSDEMFRIFGLEKSLTNLSPLQTTDTYVHPEDVELVKEKRRLIQECNQPVDFYYRIIAADGQQKTLHSITELFCDEDKPIKLYGTVQDVTKTKEVEKQLQEINLQLEHSNEALQAFAYIASHDLKEPVRKIIAFSERLATTNKDRLSEDGKFYISRISASAMRMLAMVDDLLALSLVAHNKEFKEISLQQLLDETIQTLEHTIAEKQAAIKSDHLPSAQIIPSQFRQLFQNLIANSLKFAKKDMSVEISVNHRYLNADDKKALKFPDKEYLQIIFTDNGIGFENQYSAKIFAMFQRLNGRSEYEGTGIGLSICKRIIENHNGTIIAQGEPGVGATFIITIPAK